LEIRIVSTTKVWFMTPDWKEILENASKLFEVKLQVE